MALVKRSAQQRGNALIEFVLVLPLLLTIMLAAIDWGWYFAIREVATNAARQGARVGSAADTEAHGVADAPVAARSYLQNALGASYAVLPTASAANCPGLATVPTPRCITVSFTAFPVVPSRPTATISGLGAWTHAPATLNVRAEMRLERP